MSVVLYKILCFISPSHRCDSVKAVKGKQPLSWSQTQSYSSKQLEYVFTFLLLLLFLVVSAVVLLVCTFKCLFVYCKLFCRKIVLNFLSELMLLCFSAGWTVIVSVGAWHFIMYLNHVVNPLMYSDCLAHGLMITSAGTMHMPVGWLFMILLELTS